MAGLTLDDAMRRYAKSPDRAHSTQHINAVWHNAKKLLQSYPNINEEDLRYAVVLHDISHDLEYDGKVDNHAKHGVIEAEKYLPVNMDSKRKRLILEAIEDHMGRVGTQRSQLGKILADADRLAAGADNLALRMYTYRRDKGMGHSDALRSAYWYLRHKKFKTRQPYVWKNLSLPESYDIMKEKLTELDDKTKTFVGFQKFVGIDQPREYKESEYRKGGENMLKTSADLLLQKLATRSWKQHPLSDESRAKLENSGVINYDKEINGLVKGNAAIARKNGINVIHDPTAFSPGFITRYDNPLEPATSPFSPLKMNASTVKRPNGKLGLKLNPTVVTGNRLGAAEVEDFYKNKHGLDIRLSNLQPQNRDALTALFTRHDPKLKLADKITNKVILGIGSATGKGLDAITNGANWGTDPSVLDRAIKSKVNKVISGGASRIKELGKGLTGLLGKFRR